MTVADGDDGPAALDAGSKRHLCSLVKAGSEVSLDRVRLWK